MSPSLTPLSFTGAPTIVTPGWEIYDQIVGAQCNNKLYTQSSQFTSPNLISAPLWKFDVDDPNYGVPTMQVTIGDIHHVDFSGNDIPDTQAAETLPAITIGNDTYYFDEHIYLLTVTIRSIADVKQEGTAGLLGTIPVFEHETSWPYQYATPTQKGTIDTPPRVGKEFDGGAYVAFVINPWRGASSDSYSPSGLNTSKYVLTNAWAGVMNAYVLNVVQGQIANQYSGGGTNNNGLPSPAADAPLEIKGAISYGNQVPMFLDNGAFSSSAPAVNFDNSLSPDARIPSSVALYLPIDIFPGAGIHNNALFITDAVYPADGYVMYTLRIDVLQAHDYTLETAIKPPTPSPPVDYYTWAQDFWTSFLHGLDPFAFLGPLEPLAWWLVTFGIGILVIVVLIAIFAPWVLPRLAATAKDTYNAVRSNKKTNKS